MEDKQGVWPRQDAADVNRDSTVYHISHNNKLHVHFPLHLNGELRNHASTGLLLIYTSFQLQMTPK